MIKLENVTKIYKAKKTADTVALKDLNVTINSKGLVFIVGTSGSGKSTLLNCLGGLDSIDEGSIVINGMDITKLKEKELDKFRNSYLGFVFQDYNIIEDYDVYDNINLALELQGIDNPDLVSDTLNKLGLRSLEKRKINELSGGQKQRVAIARALVKNPSLILADEPTGNLDSASSKQIFEILKEISKERTVIVVSHDKDMAKKYGDRIIEISDGEIIKETKAKKESVADDEIHLIQSNISRRNILKLTLGNMVAKKGKLILTIILMSFAIFFASFAFNIYIFSPASLAYDTMEKNNEYYLTFFKEKCILDFGEIICSSQKLTDEDISNMSKKANLTLNKTYSLMDGEELLDLNFLYEKNDSFSSYYDTYYPVFTIIEDESVLANIKGNVPISSNEIVISERIAEKIVKYGVMDANNLVYKPNSLEALLKDKKELTLGANKVIVVGYLEDSDPILEPVKELKEIRDESLSQYFLNYANKYEIYVSKTFMDDVKLTIDYDYIAKTTYPYLTYYGKRMAVWGDNKTIFTDPVEVLTNDGNRVIDYLNEDEIIIPISGIKYLYENFETEYYKYAEEHPDLTYNEVMLEFIKVFIVEKNLLSKPVTFTRYDLDNEYSGKVVGISLDDNLYYSLDLVKKYSSYNKLLTSAETYQTEKKTIKRLFNTFTGEGSYLKKEPGMYDVISFKYIDHVNSTKGIYNSFYNFIVAITVVFILFGILLFYNFITTTISYSKKKIGILRAIGASNKDVAKIFRYESIIIGITAGIVSIFVWIFANNIINKVLHYELYNAKFIILEPLTFIIIFIFIIIFATLLTASGLSRVAKIKPIDAILEKK